MGVNGHWYIEIEKQGFWRGLTHTFVNRYVMSGAQPSAADANATAFDLLQIEDAIFPAAAAGLGVGFVQTRCYPTGSGSYYASTNYNTSLAVGTTTGYGHYGLASSFTFAPTLETCLLVETKLQGLNSRGKPTYLRKYFRGIMGGPEEQEAPGSPITPALITYVNTNAAAWKTGVGPENFVVIGDSGSQAAVAPTAHPFLVAHQVPRGKKRKVSSSSASSFEAILGDAAHIATLASVFAD